MCHHIEEREWAIEAEERDEYPGEPAESDPSFVEPGDPEVSLDRDYEATMGDD